MGTASVSSGTLAVTSATTEYVLESSPITASGVYVLRVDLSSMVRQDGMEVRVKTKALLSSALTTIQYLKFSGVQSLAQMADTDPVAIDGAVADRVSFTLKMPGFTSPKNIPLNILKIG